MKRGKKSKICDAERERCAKVAEDMSIMYPGGDANMASGWFEGCMVIALKLRGKLLPIQKGFDL